MVIIGPEGLQRIPARINRFINPRSRLTIRFMTIFYFKKRSQDLKFHFNVLLYAHISNNTPRASNSIWISFLMRSVCDVKDGKENRHALKHLTPCLIRMKRRIKIERVINNSGVSSSSCNAFQEVWIDISMSDHDSSRLEWSVKVWERKKSLLSRLTNVVPAFPNV